MCSSKEGENLNDVKFGTSVGRFSSDSAASTAVKGLKTPSPIPDARDS